MPALVLAALSFASPLASQLRPPSTGGLPALDQQLRTLGQYKRVLVIGAHPDDEDTELLTILVRGMGADAAYLSLNRGEGGQNLIGEELGEALGLLRTEELLAARQLDGAQQFFTRAYDFGYSKSLDDTWAHWPRDSVLKDVVRVVRRFRPQIIVSVFSGTPGDGHGQHQAAGWVAAEAFQVAGDSARFPELGREEGLGAWMPLKLYRGARFDTAGTTLRIQGGVIDPAVGQSYLQIAMRSRSLHRSQDMGQIQRLGPSVVRLRLEADRTSGSPSTASATTGLFDGIDTTLAGTPAVLGMRPQVRDSVRRLLVHYAGTINEARASLSPPEAARVPGLLRSAAGDLAAVIDPRQIPRPFDELQAESSRLAAALTQSLALLVDAYTDDPRVVPGQEMRVAVPVWNAGTTGTTADLCLIPQGFPWRLELDSASTATVPLAIHRGACLGYSDNAWVPLNQGEGSLPAGALATARVRVTAPAKWQPTSPYFLRQPRAGDLYRWDPADRSSWGLPFEPSPFAVELQLPNEPIPVRLSREVIYRTNDQASGEVRLPLTIVPRVDVKLDPSIALWRTSGTTVRSHRVVVTLTHGATDTTAGEVRLSVPPGWPQPAPRPFTLSHEGERQTFTFDVLPPRATAEGEYDLSAVAVDRRGQTYETGTMTVAYPHIRPRSYLRPAAASIRLASVVPPSVGKIGYVRGAADRVPEALTSVGISVDLLRGSDLEHDGLSRYSAIVIGPRAFETDPDLSGNNDRLLAFARAGGLVLVQYQQYAYFLGGYAPFPMTVGTRAPGTVSSSGVARSGSPSVGSTALLGGHDRVTDETAPVTMLRTAERVLNRPNRIAATDWDGWIQERGLYFAHSWDPKYRSVLEMHDPGEPPLEGGLLIAPVGKGSYVYTGLSFFRQLPAGVPGAYRLFANLLALAKPAPR